VDDGLRKDLKSLDTLCVDLGLGLAISRRLAYGVGYVEPCGMSYVQMQKWLRWRQPMDPASDCDVRDEQIIRATAHRHTCVMCDSSNDQNLM
jgi:hypothetical protein